MKINIEIKQIQNQMKINQIKQTNKTKQRNKTKQTNTKQIK